jgi:hypothetical protein
MEDFVDFDVVELELGTAAVPPDHLFLDVDLDIEVRGTFLNIWNMVSW